MVVSTFAFAWWLVSLPTMHWSAASTGELSRAQLSHETRATQTVAQAASDGTSPASPERGRNLMEEPLDGEWSGKRVALKIVTPEIIRVARGFLDLPMGDERFVAIDGHRYVFVLERHYHPPGFVGAPNGWHKGVTVYELR
jgi:hypothetical protein